MIIITVIRFIYSLNYLDKLFVYNSNASYRIIKLLGNNINFSFFIRCLFSEKALETVFVFLFGITAFFTVIIRILEFDNPKFEFSDMFNSMWFSFVTMVTVGYGDFTPISMYGKVFSFFIGITGVMLTNLITVVLSE